MVVSFEYMASCIFLFAGVTQELIDEMRVAREKNMYTDLKLLIANNGDLEYRDRNGATPVSQRKSRRDLFTYQELRIGRHY